MGFAGGDEDGGFSLSDAVDLAYLGQLEWDGMGWNMMGCCGVVWGPESGCLLSLYSIVVDSYMLMSAAVDGTSCAFADGLQQDEVEEARGSKRMRLCLVEGSADASTSL